MRIDRSPVTRCLAAAAFGAVGAIVAWVLCFVLCYVLAKSGVRFFAGSDTVGASVLRGAALNVYTIQHVPLFGAGSVTDAAGTTQNVSATVLLPITIWAVLPVIALLAGGFVAARLSPSARWSAAAALAGGMVYALLMAVLSLAVSSHIAPNLIPEIDGNSFNPPEILFHPKALGAFTNGLLFGIPLMYCGNLLTRRQPGVQASPWGRTVKVVLLADLIILALAGTAFAVYATKSMGKDAPGGGSRLAEMAPAAAGIAYAVVCGVPVNVYAGSEASIGDMKTRLIDLRVDMFGGITREEGGHKTRSRFPVLAALFALFGIKAVGNICGFVLSSDKARSTAARATAVHLASLCALVALCNLKLLSSVVIADVFSRTTATISLRYSWMLILSLLFYFSGLMDGAWLRARLRAKAQ